MGKPKAPAAPDPKETAAAQTGTNVTTALANSTLNSVDQFTPDGSITYGISGYEAYTDPSSGATYTVPRRTQTTTLSPQQQAIKAQTDAASLNLGTIAKDQSAFLRNYLNRPFDGSNEATEARLMELGRKRLDPVLSQQDEALRTRLANQGIKAGSSAYDREVNLQNQARADAYNQLLLQGRGQAFQEAQTIRNQPINEISALLSGSQVSMPQSANPYQTQIPTVDYAGLVQQDYANRVGAYNQQMAQRQNLLGGLFGLGSAFIMSDKRTKENIKPVGKAKGHKLYSYNYKADPQKTPQIGVMAQEVERKRPDAVTELGGIKHVNYGRLFGLGEGRAA